MNDKLFDIGAALDTYFELGDLTTVPAGSWSERAFQDNLPRLLRFQQLQSLLRAFGLSIRAQDLSSGGFLQDREPASYQFLHDELTTLHQQGELFSAPRSLGGPAGWGMVYQHFVHLLQLHHRLQRVNGSWLEASLPQAQYAILVAQRFVDSYDAAQLAAIRRTVCRLLDPAQRHFSRQELVQRFKFPDVNILDVDIEWM